MRAGASDRVELAARSSSSSVSVIASTGSPLPQRPSAARRSLRATRGRSPSVEDLGDRADRGRRDHHRAEDRLLGLEVLGRHGSSDCERGGGHGWASNRARAVRAVTGRRRTRAGRTEHTFESYPQTRTTCPQQGRRRHGGNVRTQREVQAFAHSPCGQVCGRPVRGGRGLPAPVLVTRARPRSRPAPRLPRPRRAG